MTPEFLYVGLKGRVLALDRSTGEVVWESKLKGSQMVTMPIENDCIFASTQGEVFCVDLATGAQIWKNTLPGMGMDLACLATKARSNTLALQQQAKKQQQDAAASS